MPASVVVVMQRIGGESGAAECFLVLRQQARAQRWHCEFTTTLLIIYTVAEVAEGSW
jgi:hypothetical protein